MKHALLDSALPAIAAALPGARLHGPAGRRAQLVDAARDVVPELSFQGDAALLRAAQAHVPFALRVDHGELAQQARVLRQRSAPRDLHVVDVGFGAVLVGVAAAGAAGLAVEDHADSFARPGGARCGNSSTCAAGRSMMRKARKAAPNRAAAPSRKRACAATSGRPPIDHAPGRYFTVNPPAAEPKAAASPP